LRVSAARWQRHGGEQDAGVEQFLSDPGGGVLDHAGKRRYHASAQCARQDAAPYPQAATGHALAAGHDDADDERRLQHLAEDDERG